jgi:cell wall assembly regulator SMI1
MVEFENTDAPLSAAEIAQIERDLGFVFPTEFRNHYLQHNGGQPEPNRLDSGDSAYVVHEFMPLIADDPSTGTLSESFQNLKEQDTDFFPKHLVPFARDEGGDFFCFSIREKDKGSIWKFNMDYYDDPSRNCTYLTANLTEFLDKLW